MRAEIFAMLRLGTRLDLTQTLEYMRQHGQSVLLNWGEDDNLWECSWITGGERHTGVTNREPIQAVLNCLSIVADAMDQAEPERVRSHNDVCGGCGSPADAARIRGSVAGGFGALALKESIDKGNTIEIPALGMTYSKKDGWQEKQP